MGNLDALFHGFTVALTFQHLLLMVGGVLLGILVGVLPGLGAPNGVTLLLPLTFGMEPVSAIILLSSDVLGRAVRRLDDVDPVQHPGRALVGRDDLRRLSDGEAGPGRRGADARVPVGRLRRAGRRRRHHAAVELRRRISRCGSRRPNTSPSICLAFASFIGMGGALALQDARLDRARPRARGRRHGHGLRRLRLTFGIDELLRGVSFLVAVIGLFGIGEMLLDDGGGPEVRGRQGPRRRLRDVLRTLRGMPRYWVALLRSASIGVWMGITPGGPTAASFMSYGLAKRFSRRRDKFGKRRAGGRHLARDRRPRGRLRAPCCRCWRSASRARRPPP